MGVKKQANSTSHCQDQRPELPWEEPQRRLSCASLWWPRAELPREPSCSLSWGLESCKFWVVLPCELFFKRTDCHPNTFSQDHLWCCPERISTCRGQRLGYRRTLLSLGSSLSVTYTLSLPAFHSFLPFLLSSIAGDFRQLTREP